MDIQQFSCQTPETLAIREEYPSLAGLEAGDISVWLQERFDQLLSVATQNQTNADAAKVLNLTCLSAGLVTLTSTPFGWLGAVLGGGFWAWTVVDDFFDTGKFHPLPFVRCGLIELLQQGDAEEREARRAHLQSAGISEDALEMLRVISYLERRHEPEARMLLSLMPPIAGFLELTPPGKRFTAYRWLIREYKLRGGFSHVQQADIDKYTATAMPDRSLDYEAISAYRQGPALEATPPPPTSQQLADAQARRYTPGPITQLGGRQTVDTIYETSPWLADAKVTPGNPETGKSAKLTLSEDNFIDKVDQTVDSRVAERFGEEFEEIRIVQAMSNHEFEERLEATNSQLTELKSMLEKALQNKTEIVETGKTLKSPERLEFEGVSALNSPEINVEINNETTSVMPETGVHIKPFDPLQPDQKKEFLVYRSLVEIEELNPVGVEIIKRMWGAKPGNNKAYKAAEMRRNQYAERLSEYQRPRLHGE